MVKITNIYIVILKTTPLRCRDYTLIEVVEIVCQHFSKTTPLNTTLEEIGYN